MLATNLASAQESGARHLIITHDQYYEALQPLAQWKTQKGVKAKVVKLSDIGYDSVQIKNYITDAYNTWPVPPEYALFVGNKYQLPFPQFLFGGGIISHSDNYYTNVTGDFHNEIIPGRLWINDTLEAKTVVAKILGYERNPHLTDSLWFRKGVTIINEYGIVLPFTDSVYWDDARYTHQLMSNAGFVHIDSFAYSLNHSSSDVLNAMNEGRSYILYRGLGFTNWLPPFDNISVWQMNNGSKLPVVISATCATIEGIGVDWVKAGTPDQPKGMVGFFGTTTALDEVAHLRSALAKGTLASIFTDSSSTLGKAAEAGRLYYYSLFNNTLEYNSWTCLGDPEMTLWTTTPREIDVTHPVSLPTGSCTINVQVEYEAAPVESALVCMMAKQDTTKYQYMKTNALGDVAFVDSLVVPDTIIITVTGRNLRSYAGLVTVSENGREDQSQNSHDIAFAVYPSLFKKNLIIEYALGKSTQAFATAPELNIYNALGQVVKQYRLPQSQNATTTISWDAKDDKDEIVPAGVYFIRLTTYDHQVTRKVILLE
jgi:hypothetical protein